MSQSFNNRELSLLEFHRRVLHQAYDDSLPIMERLRFLGISSTNLDEFFEVRIGGLIELIEAGSVTAHGPDGVPPEELLEILSERIHSFVDEQYRALVDMILPLLRDNGIRILKRHEWNDLKSDYLRQYFEDNVLPLLSPIGLDPAHPFPRIMNKSLNFIVKLHGKDAFGRMATAAIVQVPRSLPHMIELPNELVEDGGREFILISSIIHFFMSEVFLAIEVVDSYQFRLTRNSDIFLDEEEAEDLLRAVQGELAYRQYGDEIRLEVAENCPQDLQEFLLKRCNIPRRDLYTVNGPVNINRLSGLFDLVKDSQFYYPAFEQSKPKIRKRKNGVSTFFEALRREDILLYHPFDSFNTVVEFIRQASQDPKVLAIKQTLYRAGAKSPIVDALISAARAGKEVTAIIELRARFDEEENVAMAELLQRYGVHVIYGVVGFKTHAKMLLIARKESDQLRYYVHLGTGNYHTQTTKVYTDYGLMTANQKVGGDVDRLFLQLSSMGKVSKMDALLHAPFTLHKSMLKKIQREAQYAQAGKKSRIIIKVNSLYDEQLTQALYDASQAGVKIDLIVRGICQLVPGIEGLSENIHVRSIVGRFLEHSRVFYFYNDGKAELYCSSADWMLRNMHHRVETCFPIEHKSHRERILDDLNTYLADNTHAWELQSNCEYKLLEAVEGEEVIDSQEILLNRWARL